MKKISSLSSTKEILSTSFSLGFNFRHHLLCLSRGLTSGRNIPSETAAPAPSKVFGGADINSLVPAAVCSDLGSAGLEIWRNPSSWAFILQLQHPGCWEVRNSSPEHRHAHLLTCWSFVNLLVLMTGCCRWLPGVLNHICVILLAPKSAWHHNGGLLVGFCLLPDPGAGSRRARWQARHYREEASISPSHAAFGMVSKISRDDQSGLCVTSSSNT